MEFKKRKNWIIEKYRKIGIVRYIRIKNYIRFLESNIKITKKKDIETTQNIKKIINNKIKTIKVFHILIIISYFGIYFSFLSIFIIDILLITELTQLSAQTIGIVGTALFFIILFISTRLRDLYYEDLNLLSSHFIAICNKYADKNKKSLFSDTNKYPVYINYLEES